MLITIAERLRPYRHQPDTWVLLPRTPYAVQIFPALIRFYELTQGAPRLLFEAAWEIQGPLRDFTVMCDLEKGQIVVWGEAAQGWLRYRLIPIQGAWVQLEMEKAPEEGITFHVLQGKHLLQKKDSLILGEGQGLSLQPLTPERLSLGNHKAQDWDFIQRRASLTEIFPIWYRLGCLTPCMQPLELTGTATLLKPCQEAISSGHPETISQPFQHLFLAGFQGILVPRLMDTHYQGLCPPPSILASPLPLLTEGARLIRSLFIRQEKGRVNILPALPPEFHCGRFTQIQLDGLVIDLEWSKKTLRRLKIFSEINQEIQLTFSQSIKQFRLREHPQAKGQRCASHSTITLNQKSDYLLDNFS